MKLIALIAIILILILFLFRNPEKFIVDETIFTEVEIPTDSELAKDPYYQYIKNIDFPCMNV
jgi:hypothetical protein